MFIDTHCHLDTIVCFGSESATLNPEKFKIIAQLIDEAKNAGVLTIFNVGCDVLTSHNSIEIAKKFTEVFAIIGLHPYEGKSGWQEEFYTIKKMVINRNPLDKIIGIGEIGLDYSRENSNRHAQQELFKNQLNLALEQNLPISFHVRDAADDFLKIIEPYSKELRGVVHCFQQDQAFARQVTSWGLLLGIDGPITYPKNTYLREITQAIDLKYLVLETDAPFLPVQKERGKINYPSKIPLIGQALAVLKNLSVEEIAAATTDNATSLFLTKNYR